MLKMSSTCLHVLSQLLLKPGTASFCGQFSQILLHSATLSMQKLCLAWDEALKKLRASLARHDICRRFNLESYVAIVSSESFADSSRAGLQALLSDIMLCTQRRCGRAPCISLNLLLRLAAIRCSFR